MENILIDISLTISLIIIGWYLREYAARRVVKRLLDEHGIDPEMESENIVVCYMETHDDMIYLYGVSDDKFYAHAKTHEEMHETLDKLYPGKKFIVPDEDEVE